MSLQQELGRALRSLGSSCIAPGPVAYAAGAGLAWVNEIAAFVCYAAIALYFVFPPATRTLR